MDQILSYVMLGGALFALILWIGDALQRRRKRPDPVRFELTEFDDRSATAIPADTTEQREPSVIDAPPAARNTADPYESIANEAPPAKAPPAAQPADDIVPKQEPELEQSWLKRMRAGLGKTRSGFGKNLSQLFSGGRSLDQDLLEEIETLLITADVGMAATQDIIAAISDKLSRQQIKDADAVKAALRQELIDILEPCAVPLDISTNSPFMLLVVGVNGVGKTTTIGKLASHYSAEGSKVLLAAGDTFRAAAVEQLQAWGERANVPVIAQHQGADSASVLFDAMQSATARRVDLAIADTAGRLQNRDELMNELKKVVRVIKKHDESAPHEVLLVVDATTGQNALSQVKLFGEAVGVSGIAVTKLDGTAKGGILFAVAKQSGLPIRFIGVGEGVNDLQPFSAAAYVDAMLG